MLDYWLVILLIIFSFILGLLGYYVPIVGMIGIVISLTLLLPVMINPTVIMGYNSTGVVITETITELRLFAVICLLISLGSTITGGLKRLFD